MLYNKRGALTTRQIVILIILIVSFIIILFLIFRLSLQEESKKQICHNSVVQRGSALSSLIEVVPLNCETEYICISATSKCEDSRMRDPKIITVTTEEEFYKALADEMADCWWMYGEGEIDYLGEIDLIKAPYCSICSSIIFEKSISEKIFNGEKSFDVKKLEKYLFITEYNEKMTYAEYFYKQKFSKEQIQGDVFINAETKEGQVVRSTEIDLSANYYILTALNSKPSTLGWVLVGIATGIVVTAITIATFGTGAIIIAGVVGVVAGTGGTVGGLILTIGDNEVIPPMLIHQDDVGGINCENIKSLS